MSNLLSNIADCPLHGPLHIANRRAFVYSLGYKMKDLMHTQVDKVKAIFMSLVVKFFKLEFPCAEEDIGMLQLIECNLMLAKNMKHMDEFAVVRPVAVR